MSSESARTLANRVCDPEIDNEIRHKSRQELAALAERGNVDAVCQLERISTSTEARTRDRREAVKTLRNTI